MVILDPMERTPIPHPALHTLATQHPFAVQGAFGPSGRPSRGARLMCDRTTVIQDERGSVRRGAGVSPCRVSLGHCAADSVPRVAGVSSRSTSPLALTAADQYTSSCEDMGTY